MLDFIWKWALGKFKDYVLRNWKTTLVGVISYLIVQVPALVPYKEKVLAAAVALMGLLAKDGDKTGTTATASQAMRAAPGPVPQTEPVAVDIPTGGMG
jgi:hypothetical protein